MRIFLFLLFFMVRSVDAQVWAGPNSRFKWEASSTPDLVQGYRLYIKDSSGVISSYDVGLRLGYPVSSIDFTPGAYEAWVTAFNPAAESKKSNILPFSYADPNEVVGPPQTLKMIQVKPQ